MTYIDTFSHPSRICFGKHDGTRLTDAPRSYLSWMLRSIDALSWDEKRAIEMEINRRNLHDDPAANQERQGRSTRGQDSGNRYHTSGGSIALPADVTPQTIIELISAGRQAMAKRHHPDVGGDTTKMRVYNQAADYLEKQARSLVGGASR